MTARRLRAALAAGAAVLALATASVPAHAQWIVFDPTNFSQNVLTAARELQQVNNEIQSLENQATMLINQARNLASLPYSALAQLEQSITQTEQLLTAGAAHRLQRRHHRSGVHADLPASLFEFTVQPATPRRCADALAELARRLPGRHARAGRRRAESRQHAHADQCADLGEPVGDRRASSRPGRQSAHGAPDQAACRPHRRHGGHRARPEPGGRAQRREPVAGAATAFNFLNYGPGYQPGSAQMFH